MSALFKAASPTLIRFLTQILQLKRRSRASLRRASANAGVALTQREAPASLTRSLDHRGDAPERLGIKTCSAERPDTPLRCSG
jgi:hypothetical protein